MARSPAGKGTERRLLTGAFHPELENALLEHLETCVSEDPLSASDVVVPTNLLGVRLSRLLAERRASGGAGGHANVRFMTLKDLALGAAGNPLPDGRALLPPGGDEVVLRKLMETGLATGGYFEAIADRPGLTRALLSAIRDLKEACYTVDSLAETAGAAGLLRKGRDCKLTELVRVWRAYESVLSEDGWADTLDAMAACLSIPKTGGDPAPAPFVLYGFYDLNALQKKIVARRASVSGATVYFPFLDTPAFDYARPTLEWFVAIGFDGIELGGRAASGLPLPEDVRIISAPGEAREAREDVRELVAIFEEDGSPFQSAAVLLRSSDGYADLFREELEGAGARPYLESPPPLSRTRSGRSLVKLAEVVSSDFARVEVTEFLSLADVALDGWTGEPPAADWNKATILAGITSGGESWGERLSALGRRLDAGEGGGFVAANRHLARPLELLVPLVESIVDGLSGLPARATLEEFLRALLAVFGEVTGPSGERSDVVSAATGLNALSAIAGPVTFPYFVELLRACLNEPGERSERFGAGGPTVLNLMAARGQSFPTVIVPGLVEKGFPATRRQDPILLDFERERLNRAAGCDPLSALPLRSAAVDEERLLFHHVIASAEKHLLLSFPRLDAATARPRVPSAFLLGVLEERTGERHDYEKLETSEFVTRIPLSRRFPPDRRRALTREEFDGCSVLSAVESGDPAEIAYLVQREGPLPRRLRMEEVRWGTPAFTEYDAALTSPEAAKAIAALSGFGGEDGTLALAPTVLEEYARCPFAFFMRQVLDVEPMEEPDEALILSPIERGSLYHEALERFMRRAKDEGLLPLSPEVRGALREVASEVAASGRWSLSGVAGARELALRNLMAGLSLWLASETLEQSTYVPTYFEARFGGRLRKGDDPELSTEEGVPFEAAGDLRICFGGKIDRVDVSGDGSRARVIDYKTGRPEPKGRKVFDGGTRMQLPVYLMAASEMLSRAGVDALVESAEYLYVGGRAAPSRLRLTREELEEARADLSTAVGLIVRGVTAGMFFAPPDDPGCSRCDYADACGSTATTLSSMKRGDPRAEFFTTLLREIV
jgi:ATP-dependent helicase/nuclease subunit B